ncbi:hypothetical protein I0Q12_00145 [Rhodococcus sp. CX]|uniref:hypothetical protein n=1 Tax=Rhodococcus sp. CX TaxID=2789880 RepID=UPI0018CE3274|nr:hypothetical protein [Rhodococcus sp. CX]MBH0118026.1 hypothetical protein [Rhodococcus sp. CX]
MATSLHLASAVEIKARAGHAIDGVVIDLGSLGSIHLERDDAFALADQLRDALRELAARPQEES